MSQGFSGDRYYPPAAAAAPPVAAELPARPAIAAVPALVVGSVLRVSFGTPRAGLAWLVRRITVQNTATGRAYVYVGGYEPQHLVSGTRAGTFDENECVQPIFVPEGAEFGVQFFSAITGQAMARIEYVEV